MPARRACSPPWGIEGRWRGWAVTSSPYLLPGCSSASPAGDVARALQGSLAPSIQIGGREFRVRASVGIAVAAAGSEVMHLLANADLALYRAKAAGGGQCRVFDAAMPHCLT